MKKYITSVAGIFAIFFLGNFYNYGGFQSVTSQVKSDIEALQDELPSKIDSLSTTIGARFEGNVLSYDVALDIQIDNNSVNNFQRMQWNANIFAACLNDKLLRLLSEIDVIEYNYFINNRGVTFTNRVSETDCQPFVSGNKSDFADYYVELQNATVPVVLDADTNLVHYSAGNDIVTVDYQLHSWLASELDVAYLKNYVDNEVIPVMCQAPDFRALSNKGYGIKVQYLDARNVPVYVTTVPMEDCS